MTKITFLERAERYDGSQLGTAFFDRHAPGEIDGMVLFEGPAEVEGSRLVDLEDAEAGAVIGSHHMAHVLLEHRDVGLREMVWRQRMLGRLAATWIASRSGVRVDVHGDDLFVGDGKLSVSVATSSPRGCLIHFAVNVEIEDTPVKTAGLRDLRIVPRDFLRSVSRLYDEELRSVLHAVAKVRPVP